MTTVESQEDRQEIRHLIRTVVSDPEKIAGLTPMKQDLAIRIARRCRILGRLGAALDEKRVLKDLPQVVVDQLSGAVAMANARRRLAMWELDRIAWASKQNPSMPLIAMKGCAYVLLDLPNAAGRVFADVDIMTSEDELAELEALLNQCGWQTQVLSPYDDNYYRNWTHELPPLMHSEREMEIDLHHNILPRTSSFHPDSDSLIARSRRVPGSRYQVLANEDLVIHAIVHLFVDSDLEEKLRDLVDIVEMGMRFEKEDVNFWSKLIDRSTELGLGRPVFYAIRYGKILLGLEIPELAESRADKWSPNRLVLAIMDRATIRALLPVHPDRHSRLTAVYRQLLYIRSHWLRMPLFLLVYHLSFKLLVTRLSRKPKPHSNRP